MSAFTAEQAVQLREAAYALSCYAASSELENTPEFLDGLFEQIEQVQALCRAMGQPEPAFAMERERPSLDDLSRRG